MSPLHKAIDDSNLSVNDKIAIRLDLGAIKMIRDAYCAKFNRVLGDKDDTTLDDIDLEIIDLIRKIN